MKIEEASKSIDAARAAGTQPNGLAADLSASRTLFQTARDGFQAGADGFRSTDGSARQDSGRMDLNRRKEDDRSRQGKADDESALDEDAILASAGLGVVALASIEMASAPAVPIEANFGHDASIDQILERIEQAIRIALRPSADAPLNIKIGLGDLKLPGLRSLELSMSQTIVEVSLVRDPSASVTPQLIAAAQALAEQLAVRLPNRTIRVVDRLARAGSASSAAAEGDGAPFRRLFRSQRDGR